VSPVEWFTDHPAFDACGKQSFGMKNKKGGKAQKFLNTISKQTATSGKSKEEVSTF
jgi:hypothetical protein